MPIKQMTRKELAQLIDARRDVPGYGDNPPAWSLTEMKNWLEGHLEREVSEAQATNFAKDAEIKLLARSSTRRRSMDSGTKFIGHCLVDFYETIGQTAPQHLVDWLQHRTTLDEAAQARAVSQQPQRELASWRKALDGSYGNFIAEAGDKYAE